MLMQPPQPMQHFLLLLLEFLLGPSLIARPRGLPFLTPYITEASTIAWAIEIAKSENFQDIVVESDAKVCIDAINEESARVPWKLLSLCINSKFLVLEFTSCSFRWVIRDAKLLTWWLTA
uniref:RNase H type-1 domain-containing protein n=1 Tax=Fagus sylvatica TaxID=28930 RepID=A0A2N9I7J7_FAGSY